MTNGVQKTYTVYKIQTKTRVEAAMAVVYLVEVTDSYAVIFYQDHVLWRHFFYSIPIVECLRVVSQTSPVSRIDQNIVDILYVHREC